MSHNHIEHWYESGNQRVSKKGNSIDGKVATVFAAVMAALVGASILLVSSGESKVAAQQPAANQAAPAATPTPPLPALSPDAIEHQPPTF